MVGTVPQHQLVAQPIGATPTSRLTNKERQAEYIRQMQDIRLKVEEDTTIASDKLNCLYANLVSLLADGGKAKNARIKKNEGFMNRQGLLELSLTVNSFNQRFTQLQTIDLSSQDNGALSIATKGFNDLKKALDKKVTRIDQKNKVRNRFIRGGLAFCGAAVGAVAAFFAAPVVAVAGVTAGIGVAVGAVIGSSFFEICIKLSQTVSSFISRVFCFATDYKAIIDQPHLYSVKKGRVELTG